MHSVVVNKSTKRSGFVIYSCFEDSSFTAVKRNAKLQTRYVKRVSFFNIRFTKGVPSLSKMVSKREMVGPRSGASPYTTPGDQERRVI